MTDVETQLARAVQAIDGADVVALACHVSPDGDALGSMLGLFHVLRAARADVVASFPSPFVVAPHYRELPGLHLLTKPEDFPAEPEVMVTFDCGSLARLGSLQPSAEAAHELIVLDHHVSNTRYGIDQRHRPRRRRERRDRPPARRGAGPRSRRRGRGLALRRAGLRHRAFPVRHHHARGLRSRARAHRVRRARVAPRRASSSRSTVSRTSSCSRRRWRTRCSTSSGGSCGRASPRTCSNVTG